MPQNKLLIRDGRIASVIVVDPEADFTPDGELADVPDGPYAIGWEFRDGQPVMPPEVDHDEVEPGPGDLPTLTIGQRLEELQSQIDDVTSMILEV